MQFKSPLMQWALSVVARAKFVVDYTGSIAMPEEIQDLTLDINGTTYTMGIGGLHSRSEERREGKECVSTCRSRWSPDPYNKKNRLTHVQPVLHYIQS